MTRWLSQNCHPGCQIGRQSLTESFAILRVNSAASFADVIFQEFIASVHGLYEDRCNSQAVCVTQSHWLSEVMGLNLAFALEDVSVS